MTIIMCASSIICYVSGKSAKKYTEQPQTNHPMLGPNTEPRYLC